MESTHPFGKLSLHSQPFHCGGSAWKSTFSASTWPRLCFNFTAWNQLDQLTQATDPKGLPTSYQRNANGEVTGWGDAVGTSTAITRDALGRPLRSQHAPGQIASLSYDKGPVGYLSAVEDQSGLTPYERDAQGRIRSKNQAVNDKPNVPGYF